jgi:hypothetical protein
MAGFTNKGKMRMLEAFYRTTSFVTNFYLALITSATTPNADTNTFADVTEITAGNGYTAGGISLTPNATDFDVLTEDDTNDRALIQIKNVVWTASGGAISGIDHAILTDDNVTQSSREIVNYFDLTGPITVSDTQTFTIIDAEMRGNES